MGHIILPGVMVHQSCYGVNNVVNYTNMGKVQIQPRSPKCAISLDRTPTVVGGKLEHFGNITDMIRHWEGMEGEEVGTGDHLLNERGRKKRISKVIRKLSGRFEEGVGNHESQPGGRGSGGREEISSITSFQNYLIWKTKVKVLTYLQVTIEFRPIVSAGLQDQTQYCVGPIRVEKVR